MSDSVILDTQFRGSPILSYGKSGDKMRWAALLLLVISVLLFIPVGLVCWFWFFTSIPIPVNTALSATLQAGSRMPVRAPEIWKQIQISNSPLPTLVGYVRDNETQALTPFAVKLSSFKEVVWDKKGIWQLRTAGNIKLGTPKSPFVVFGTPLNKPGGVRVAINLTAFFGGALANEPIPDSLTGLVKDGVFATDLSVSTLEDISNNLKSAHEDNQDNKGYILVKSVSDKLLSNFFTLQGVDVNFSDTGVLSWSKEASGTKLLFESFGHKSTPFLGQDSSGTTMITKRTYILPDEDVVQRLYIGSSLQAVSSTTSDTDNLILANLQGLKIDQSASNVSKTECPGNSIASFDKQSLVNICSWTDMCFFDLDKITFSELNNKLIICYQ